MSFQSPLLASLQRPGVEEGASPSPAPSDDIFIRRRQTPGTAERPLGSPLFASSNNAALNFHRPSPLGLFSDGGTGTGTPVGTTTTPQQSIRFLGGGARTPSSTGTNFKARLLAMQAANATGTPTTPSSSTTPGVARPGQLAWTSGRQRGATSSNILSRQQQYSGPPPPVSSLEDELLNLKINNTTATTTATTTPAKSGIYSAARETIASTTTPTGATTAGGQGAVVQQPAMSVPVPPSSTKATPPAPFSFNTSTKSTSTITGASVPQWSPLVSSTTQGMRTKGKKAVGAGALSIARSPLGKKESSTGTTDTINNVVDASILVPPTRIDDSLSDKEIYSGEKYEEKEEQQEQQQRSSVGRGGLNVDISSSGGGGEEGVVVIDSSRNQNSAKRLQHRLRSQLPEFGISEWTPPEVATTTPAGIQIDLSSTLRIQKSGETAVSKNEALKELANLRNQANGKLLHQSNTVFSAPPPGKSDDVVDEEDRVCQGVRSAFRATLPEVDIPAATPEAAAMPSPSPSPSSAAGPHRPSPALSSPLERGTRRGVVSNANVRGATQQGQVAEEIEDRLERLKLLRNQAIHVTSSSTTTSTTTSTTPIRS